MIKNYKTFIEMGYVIFMWNYFKTKYSFHNIWEAPLMNHKQIPDFFRHNINTERYESKICPLGNVAALALAGWIFFRDMVAKNSLRKDIKNINLFIFSIIVVLSFIMNLNAFIYFIPIFIYEFKLISNFKNLKLFKTLKH